MADRLVHLQSHLLVVDHDRRDPGRARVGAQQRGRLLADARRLAREVRAPRRTPSPPARSSRRARSGSCGSADPVARGQRVDAAAALDQLLLGGGALRGDEHLVLALGADRGRRHLRVLVRERLLGAQAEVELLVERHLERVTLDRRAVLAAAPARPERARGCARRARRCANATALPAAASAPPSSSRRSQAKPQAPPTRTRTPIPSRLVVVEPVDAPVPGCDRLRAPHDDARVRVRGPGAECGGHGVLAKLPHRRVP